MVKKTYDAPHSVIGPITIRVNGSPRIIKFHRTTMYTGNSGRGSQFVTCDPGFQEALEKHPLFGKAYTLFKEEVFEDNTEKEEEVPEELNVVKVDSPADARDYLFDKFNVPKRSVLAISTLKDKAKELGVVFEGI